jgi:uncharacterized membrane protein (DUF106 family)
MANLSFIKKALPWLGTAANLAASMVPGAGPIVAIATKLLSTGLSKSVTPSNLTDILTEALGDPAQLAALKASEQAYQQAMQQMGFQHETDMETIAEKDRESARSMQVATRSWIPGALAILITIGFFGLLTFMILKPPPPASEKILDVMVGTLGTAWVMVVTYYFGSSAGSDRKTELMAGNQ